MSVIMPELALPGWHGARSAGVPVHFEDRPAGQLLLCSTSTSGRCRHARTSTVMVTRVGRRRSMETQRFWFYTSWYTFYIVSCWSILYPDR